MKKIVLRFFVFALVFSVLFSSTVTCFAETYYTFDGYIYRDVNMNANTVSFSGIDFYAEELVIPEKIGVKTVVEIDDYTFKNNSVLKTIDLSQATNIEIIGIGAFCGCSVLESMVIPQNVKYLSEFMFTDCSSLKSLQLNMSPGVIPDEMCNRCYSLKSFIVPDSVKKINRFAFGSCTSLSYVKIPAGVTQIALSAFYNCPNLTLGVYDDSYALQYAKDYNIPYVLLDEYKLGDVDGNGTVDIRDVTEIQKHLAELGEPLGELNLYAADVNGDGDVDISDATAIQMFLAELDFSYPIGEITSKSN